MKKYDLLEYLKDEIRKALVKIIDERYLIITHNKLPSGEFRMTSYYIKDKLSKGVAMDVLGFSIFFAKERIDDNEQEEIQVLITDKGGLGDVLARDSYQISINDGNLNTKTKNQIIFLIKSKLEETIKNH
ncbi:MAG: hypothetical protein AABX61_00815 [Nanoarchaeota archaeon]